jgi:hypothetical protein
MPFPDLPDFLGGDDDDSDASDASDGSGLYNSDNEYSWNSRVYGVLIVILIIQPMFSIIDQICYKYLWLQSSVRNYALCFRYAFAFPD